ncbi:Permease of the drug/metabolite transporter (DMT) superfamily [hydrothermal vent metagenome]|uniref:Permease of the drug/metabolite transporter (DMT) superfamily n=1 Tax=hydrothermal vent metagenome TaxID=652676 RepID=A0A1W1EFX1_9ZZZZ
MNITNKQNKAYTFALLAVLLWSTVATAFKLTLALISPVELLLYSSIFSLIFFTIVIFYQGMQKEIIKSFYKNKKMILFSSLLNPFVYYLLLFEAYNVLPAQEAQAINYTWGLMLAYLSVPLLGHKLATRDIVAGLLCYFGVYIIATHGEIFAFEFSSIYGIGIALATTLIWALYWIANTKIKIDPIIILFLNFLFGLIFLLIYIVIAGIEISLPNKEALMGTLYIGLFEMGISFVLWLKAMKLTSNTAKISNLIYLSPPLSLFFIQTFLGEKILMSTLVALGFIFVGIGVQKIARKE